MATSWRRLPHVPPAKGVEMKREMTKEDKELAAAGYEHLDNVQRKGADASKLDHVDVHEHHLSFEELGNELDTAIDTKDPSQSHGLSSDEAKRRLARDGRNVLTPPKKKSALRKYYDCLMTMFNILLMIAGVLEYILLGVSFKDNFPNTYLGGILIAVAFLNAFIEFYQLQKSEAILASFLAMIPPSCRVVRDATIATVPAADLVKGDIVLVRSGDKTPADLVLFAASDLKVDNSSLTGESEPQERLARPTGTDARPVEADNLLFNSTLIVNGEGWGGQIAALTGGETGKQSPLATEIGRFVMMGEQTVTFAVSILVAFVPEGLPSVVTLLLSIAAKRMAAQNVLVKDLQGVETLGSLTLLATDKTGTLTRNQMTVTNLWSGERMFSAFQSNNDSETTESFSIDAPGMQEMVDIAALNSHVKFDKTDIPFGQAHDPRRRHRDWAHALRRPPNRELRRIPEAAPQGVRDPVQLAEQVGARDPRQAACRRRAHLDGQMEPITDSFKEAYDDAYNYMASRGHRVIACAQKLLQSDKSPKARRTRGHRTLRLAGIKVMMVTGDHPKTAEAIARKINLILGDTKETLSAKTGSPGWQWDQIFAKNEIVFARTSPQHKLEILNTPKLSAISSECKSHSLVRRMPSELYPSTGDGVNDSPALKKADLGIAMNISGSDVSKEAANMILLDDNFASTVKGVAEGRQIFVNLKRSIQYTISHSTPEVIPSCFMLLYPFLFPFLPSSSWLSILDSSCLLLCLSLGINQKLKMA
ncbi:Potassium-transporting ATPase alpha chain 2 [Grifola frondosa]|uniref:Potassium-transporting ATPase alpha chain 2 n=1 Tax=Grifola frondosa TaxID=5627 RepID=A0A1C7ME09_GRIFR|nr:Potassium-transporting ATPase alpha chain 2 [Grifola frondosa]